MGRSRSPIEPVEVVAGGERTGGSVLIQRYVVQGMDSSTVVASDFLRFSKVKADQL